ncbi:MAG: phage baseplate assembly protein V [Myxococcota bacterium]|nr:phage baseplate assembly protein V [Myxococcota bacterium]
MQSGGPRGDAMDNVQYGLHYALVTDNKDPDGLDRVKLRFPWLDGGDQDQSHWAQLLTPMEGDKFGWYTLPDVDDVVVVVFLNGDISHPVVVGGVWSKADSSPEPNEDGANNFRGYRSRSGHRLILDDSKKVKIVLADKTAKNVIGIGEFDKDGAGPNVCAVFTPPMAGKTGISVSTMEGKLEITCKNGKLLLDAKQKIKINAKTTVEMKAGTDIKLEGSSTAKLTSGSPSNYDAPVTNIN